MKKLPRLIVFFSLTFLVFFAGSTAFQFFALWNEGIVNLIAPKKALLDMLGTAALQSVPSSLYLTLLFGLSYSASKKIPAPVSILCLFLLGAVFTFGFSLGIKQAGGVLRGGGVGKGIDGQEGLILSGRGGLQVVLLKTPDDLLGPRVLSTSEPPLRYQGFPSSPAGGVLSLPDLPFRQDKVLFFQSLLADFSLTAGQFSDRLNSGIVPFCVYAGALIFLLSSLRFVMTMGHWPLANFFWGILLFRGVLALEAFLNAEEIHILLENFFHPVLPPSLITPCIFIALGGLILLYTFLYHIAWARRRNGGDDNG
ncbi:MAG: hypothetical protein LBR16_02470 [Treponema sp.]|jgi:hypothetical protein|nr:hypothetical protein [Treponema sp.]